MSAWWMVVLVGLLYGCASFLGVRLSAMLCANIAPFDDGPRPGKPPTFALIAGAAAIGSSLALHAVPVPALGLFVVLVVSLVACWYSDVRCGIVLDYFTLVPLALVLAVSLVNRNITPLVSALVVFLPFAFAAALSKGRGMGWGDVKLVALGAAVLGLQTSVLAFAAACLVAVTIAAIRKRRTEPIAFAPYLAGAIGAALVFPMFP